jgi:hypothetical protein
MMLKKIRLGTINGSFQKTSIPPPRRKLEINPPVPFGCPVIHLLFNIRNNFFSPPPPDGRNFLCGGSVDLFWNDPMNQSLTLFIHGTISQRQN